VKYFSYILFFVLALICCKEAQAEVYSPYAEANSLYEEGKFQQALAAYKLVEEPGKGSLSFHQNIGSCYYRLGDYANAILQFERALRHDPLNVDVKNNIDVARDQLKNPSPIYDRIFIQEWIFKLSHALPAFLWMLMGVLFVWASVFFIRKYIYANSNRFRPFMAAVVLFVLSLACISLFFSKNAWLSKDDEAVIMRKSIQVHTAPSEDSQSQFKLSGGSKVRIGEQLDGWTQILLQNDAQGWVPATAIEKI